MLGCVLFVNIIYLRVGLMLKVMFLVVYFFKVMFCIVDLKELLDLKCILGNFIVYEFFGLVEKIIKIEILIDVVEIKENVDEFLLYSLILNFDIYIGVD